MVEASKASGGAKLTYLMVGGGPGGFIGAVHKSSCDLLGQAQLVGGSFSQSYEKSREAGKTWGLDPARVYKTYQDMLDAEAKRADKPDFVIVVTPNSTHYAICKMALEKGFHVSCDKPLCFEVAEAEELVKLSGEKNLEFLVTYTYLGYPLVRQAREMVAAGELGEIRLVAAEYLQDWLADKAEGSKQAAWRTDPKFTGIAGALGDIGTHAESVAHFITGLDMTALSGSLDSFVEDRKVDDNSFIWFKTKGAAKGSIWASQVAIGKENGLSIRIYGTKGALEWWQENPNVLRFAPKGKPWELLTRGQGFLHAHAKRYTHLPTGHPEGLFEAFCNLYDGFVSTIKAKRAGRQPGPYDWYPSVVDGCRGVKFIHKVVESNSRGNAWVNF